MTQPTLAERRHALGLSIRGLARALGTHPSAVHRWERGERPVPRYIELAMLGLEVEHQQERPAT